MGIVTCAINGLYNIICRDPETAAGGLTPEDVNRHADGFYRIGRVTLDQLDGEDIDRKVEIIYNGTDDWVGLMATYDQQRQRRFGVTIRIGYFVGDHEMESQPIAGDDEHQICKAIMIQNNWPSSCSGGGCIEAYIPVSSSFSQINEEQWLLEIEVTVQVKA
jgi:hypothetical protein